MLWSRHFLCVSGIWLWGEGCCCCLQSRALRAGVCLLGFPLWERALLNSTCSWVAESCWCLCLWRCCTLIQTSSRWAIILCMVNGWITKKSLGEISQIKRGENIYCAGLKIFRIKIFLWHNFHDNHFCNRKYYFGYYNPVMKIVWVAVTVGENNCWSPADFVRLPTDKEVISL